MGKVVLRIASRSGVASALTVVALTAGATPAQAVSPPSLATGAASSTAKQGEERYKLGTEGPKTSPYEAMILGTSGLYAYWRMNETTGTTAHDLAPAKTNGTYEMTGGEAFFKLGEPGLLAADPTSKAVQYKAAAYLTFPAKSLQAPTKHVSVEAWVKTTDMKTTFAGAVVFDNSDDASDNGNYGYTLIINEDGSINWQIMDNSLAQWQTAPGAVKPNSIHHIVATYDGTQPQGDKPEPSEGVHEPVSPGKRCKIYVDGVEVPASEWENWKVTGYPAAGTQPPPGPKYIPPEITYDATTGTDPRAVSAGGSFFESYSFFDVQYSDLAIYTATLTPTQVREHYELGSKTAEAHNPPAVVTQAASEVGKTTTTLNATINPEGMPVNAMYFQYGTTTGYGSTATPGGNPGEGESPVLVTAPISGLAENTTYHFRLVAENAYGITYGPDETLKTAGATPAPPTVTTDPATGVSSISATVNGHINPNGANVTVCNVEYGPTTSYGSSAPCAPSPGSGSSPVAVSASVTGLTANTTYHFRISATNANGTGKGSDETFQTLPNPPTVATEPASSITQTSATLNGTVNLNSGNVRDCHFEYGTLALYGFSVPCASLPGSGESAVAVSASLGSLSEHTTYHFRIVVTNQSGASYGSDQTFTTEPNPPKVVTGLASALTQASATLNAIVNPNGDTVSDCRFEYGTSALYGSALPCASLPGSGEGWVAVSASLGSLSANTTYHLRIVVTNPGGSSYGSDRTFTTLPSPPTVVTEPTSSVTQTAATLNATVNPNGGTVSDCHFEYGTSALYGSSVPCASLPGPGESAVAVSAPVGGLATNSTYHFRIVATNAGGTSYGSDQTVRTLPNPPTVQTGEYVATQPSPTLRAALNPNGGEVSDCHFEYGITILYGSSVPCTTLPGSGTSVVEVFAPVGGLIETATYHFRIVATNPGGTSYGSDETFAPMPDPPSGSSGGGLSGGGSGGGGVLGSQTVFVSSAQIAALLARELTPSEKAAKIAALLKWGGLTVVFKALEAGTVVIDWYEVPAGAKLAKKAKPKPVLVGAGRRTISAAGTATIKIKLTAAGKRLLKHAKRLKLTAKGTFTPPGNAPTTTTKAFTLTR